VTAPKHGWARLSYKLRSFSLMPRTSYQGITRRLAVLATLFLIGMQSSAHAYYITDKDLIESIEAVKKNESNFDSGFYAGFISGVADAGDGGLFCIPPTVSAEQLSDTVIKYYSADPNKKYESAYRLVKSALVRAFPCDKKRPPKTQS